MQDAVTPARLAWVHPVPLRSAGWGMRGGRRAVAWPSCRLCPTAPGLRLLPDLEGSCWESHPSSHGGGWQHAARGDHRGGGSGSHLPAAPFPLEIPRAGCCPQGWRGHPGTPAWVVHPGLGCRRVPGEQPWPCGTASGQQRSCRCRQPAARLAEPRGQAGGLGAWRVLRWGKHPKAAGETLPAAPRAERIPSSGAAAPGVLRSHIALPPSLPPAPSQHPCQRLEAGFSSCHRSVTRSGHPCHLDRCSVGGTDP